MLSSTKMQVRLKPYNSAVKPPMAQDYTAAPWGIKFRAGEWYEVDKNAADYLAKVRLPHGDPNAPLAFDVCTKAEARQLVAREEAEKLGIVRDSRGDPVPFMPKLGSDAAAPSSELNQPRPKHELSAALEADRAEKSAAPEPVDADMEEFFGTTEPEPEPERESESESHAAPPFEPTSRHDAPPPPPPAVRRRRGGGRKRAS